MSKSILLLCVRISICISVVVSFGVLAEQKTEQIEIENVKRKFVAEINNRFEDEYKKELEKPNDPDVSAVVSPPTALKPFKDWDYFYLGGRGIIWYPNKGQDFETVIVPRGFVTDLASIPQLLWSFKMKPTGAYAYAAIIHDWLYWSQSRTRKESDLIFFHAMEDSKVEKGLRDKMYRAVRVGGGSAWKNNKKLKEQGERRLLVEYPPDFTISWAEWKAKPGVFGE